MGYLAVAITCSLVIGMIFKHAGRSGMDLVMLLTVNYAVAALPAVVSLTSGSSAVGALQSPGLLGLGAVTGILFIGGFFLFARATAHSGLSTSIAVMRISVAIPFVGSWFIWGEVPTPWQIAGLVVAGAALVLITRRAGSTEGADGPDGKGAIVLLAALFLSGGLVDLCMKTFNEIHGRTVETGMFVALVFVVAFVTGLAVLWRRGVPIRPDTRILRWGVFLGLVNYGSAEFLLLAVARLPGTVVFPTNGIAIVVGGALLGTIVWREKLRPANWVGIALAALALALIGTE